jgi:tetratricopeptide (TPR) repeat protein
MQSNKFPSYFEFDNVGRLKCEAAALRPAEKPNAKKSQMSQVRSNQTEKEQTSGKVNEAAIVFARATSLYRAGQLDRAIELFNEVLAVSTEEDPQRDVACVAAHISLYKIHRSLGHEREAAEHFHQAVCLGANAKRLQES